MWLGATPAGCDCSGLRREPNCKFHSTVIYLLTCSTLVPLCQMPITGL